MLISQPPFDVSSSPRRSMMMGDHSLTYPATELGCGNGKASGDASDALTCEALARTMVAQALRASIPRPHSPAPPMGLTHNDEDNVPRKLERTISAGGGPTSSHTAHVKQSQHKRSLLQLQSNSGDVTPLRSPSPRLPGPPLLQTSQSLPEHQLPSTDNSQLVTSSNILAAKAAAAQAVASAMPITNSVNAAPAEQGSAACAAAAAAASLAASAPAAKSMLAPSALALVSSALLASGGAPPGGLPCAAAAGAGSATGAGGSAESAALAGAIAASKLGLADQLRGALACHEHMANARDAEGRTCLHYAAGYGHEDCVELLVSQAADARAQDCNGDVPLHFAAIHGHPMCAYNIGKACSSAALIKNARGQTPIDVAVACERSEVLNAMLLACAGDASEGAVRAMRKLLQEGAVPDTWAPNGSSALMLAASVDGTAALKVLLAAGASIKLQDALGRSALMFAAGNCANAALITLLDANACMAQRDRRGRSVLDYAPEGSAVRAVLEERLRELELVARQRQEDLLASLGEDTSGPTAGKAARAKDGGRGSSTGSVTSNGSLGAHSTGSATGKKSKASKKTAATAAAAAAAAAETILSSNSSLAAKVSPAATSQPAVTAPVATPAGPVTAAAPSSSADAVPKKVVVGALAGAWGSPLKLSATSSPQAASSPASAEKVGAGTSSAAAAARSPLGAAHDNAQPLDIALADAMDDGEAGDETEVSKEGQTWQVVSTNRAARKGSVALGALSPQSLEKLPVSGGGSSGRAAGQSSLGSHSRALALLVGRASVERKLSAGGAPTGGGLARVGSGHSLSSMGSCDSHPCSRTSSVGSRGSHSWGAAAAHAASGNVASVASRLAAVGPVTSAPAASTSAATASAAPVNAWTARKAAASTPAQDSPAGSQPASPAPVTPAAPKAAVPAAQRTWAATVSPVNGGTTTTDSEHAPASPGCTKLQASPGKADCAAPPQATAAAIETAPVLAASPESLAGRDSTPLAGKDNNSPTEITVQAVQETLVLKQDDPTPASTASAVPAAPPIAPILSEASAVPAPSTSPTAPHPSSPASSANPAAQPVDSIDAWKGRFAAEERERQALEQRVAELSAQLAQLQPQPSEQQPSAQEPTQEAPSKSPIEEGTQSGDAPTAQGAAQTSGSAPGAASFDLAAVESLLEQAVYMERIRIVTHLLSVGMTPSALVTLLSPLATNPPAAAPGSTPPLGMTGLVPPSVKAPVPGRATSRSHASNDSHDHGSIPEAGEPVASIGASISARPYTTPLPDVPNAPGANAAQADDASDPPTASTPVAGLMQQAGRQSQSLGGSADDAEHYTTVAHIAAAEPAPAAAQPRKAMDAAAAARSFALANKMNMSARVEDRSSPSRERQQPQQPQQQQQSRPPRTAAEAAAAHVAAMRLQQSIQQLPPRPAMMPSVLSDSQIAERLSQICRQGPVQPRSGAEWDAYQLQADAAAAAAAAAAAIRRRDGGRVAAVTGHLPSRFSQEDAAHTMGMARPASSACLMSALPGGVDTSALLAGRYSNNFFDAVGMMAGDDGDPLPECGDISAALAMSDDDDISEALEGAAAGLAAYMAGGSAAGLPMGARPAHRSLDMGHGAIRAPSPSPQLASSYSEMSGGGLFAFMPAPGSGNEAGTSAPVSIPTPHACTASQAQHPFSCAAPQAATFPAPAPQPGVPSASPSVTNPSFPPPRPTAPALAAAGQEAHAATRIQWPPVPRNTTSPSRQSSLASSPQTYSAFAWGRVGVAGGSSGGASAAAADQGTSPAWDASDALKGSRSNAVPCPLPRPVQPSSLRPSPAPRGPPPSCPGPFPPPRGAGSVLSPTGGNDASRAGFPTPTGSWSSASQPLVSVMGFHSQSSDGTAAGGAPRGLSNRMLSGADSVPCIPVDRTGARLPAKSGLSGSMGANGPADIARAMSQLASVKVTQQHAPNGEDNTAGNGSSSAGSVGRDGTTGGGVGLSVDDVEIPPSAVRRSQACRSGVASPFGMSASPPLASAGMMAAEQALARPGFKQATSNGCAVPVLKTRSSGPAAVSAAATATPATLQYSPSRHIAMFEGANDPLRSVRAGFAGHNCPAAKPPLFREPGAWHVQGIRTACMPSPCGSPGGAGGAWGMWQANASSGGGAAGAGGVAPAWNQADPTGRCHARHSSDSWALRSANAATQDGLQLPDCL